MALLVILRLLLATWLLTLVRLWVNRWVQFLIIHVSTTDLLLLILWPSRGKTWQIASLHSARERLLLTYWVVSIAVTWVGGTWLRVHQVVRWMLLGLLRLLLGSRLLRLLVRLTIFVELLRDTASCFELAGETFHAFTDIVELVHQAWNIAVRTFMQTCRNTT